VVINLQKIEQANTDGEREKSEAPMAHHGTPSNKEIVEALSILRKAVQHTVDKKGFEQYYSYENMVMVLLDTKKTNIVGTYLLK